MILAGDVGGTKTLLALVSPRDGPRQLRAERSFPSRQYPGLEAVLKEYRKDAGGKLEFACFGLPGPIAHGVCETPNLPWRIERHSVEQALGAPVALINDLEATGYGIDTLQPDELWALSEGRPQPDANAALIAPGTGLGEAILFWDGRQHRPSASEGGHADFAPRTPLEADLLRYLWREFPRVSFDRVLSGKGLRSIYNFLRDTGVEEEPARLRAELEQSADANATISAHALGGGSPLCARALDLWVSVYGAEAGNLALKALARAGVFLGGGITPKILPKLKDGAFLAAFHDKGRLRPLVEQIPVRIILQEKTALYGAARAGILALAKS